MERRKVRVQCEWCELTAAGVIMESLTRGEIFQVTTVLFGNNFVNKPKQILHIHNTGIFKFFLVLPFSFDHTYHGPHPSF